MKILVYANVGLNLVDGSTIWVESVVEVLSKLLDCQVILLSRDKLEDRGVVPALRRLDNVRIICCADFPDLAGAHEKSGDRFLIERIIKRLDAEMSLDRIVVRDPELALVLARVVKLRGKLWAYLLDSPPLDCEADRSDMEELVDKAGGLIVQSDTQRGLLEAVFPSACNKTSILPPMVKPVAVEPNARLMTSDLETVRFIYSGKYSAAWNVEAFFDVPQACREAGVDVTVTMIGDKVHDERSDRDFRSRILHKFRNTPRVNWLGAMDREAAITASATHDLGLCWRTSALNDSLEISTKFLEFASVGVPSVVNRTAAYESLLGHDYPYFADSMAEVVSAAEAVVSHPERHAHIARQCRELAAGFTYDAAAKRLREALRFRHGPSAHMDKTGARLKLLVASHDLKFLTVALRFLGELHDVEINYDIWSSTTTHDAAKSSRLLQQADVIFCEWCAGAAVWYSDHKMPHQRLFVRLHRFETNTHFPGNVRADAIDGIIVVSDYFRDLCIERFGWRADQIVVLPQYCVANQLRRSKHPGAEKTLGFVGVNGFHHKRFDRALDVLRAVRRTDPSFCLRIRSAMPWEFSWIWRDNKDERRKFKETFRALESDRDLRNAVVFDRPGANMSEWYRNVGFILSTSESEGCHTCIAEGICSGALPVLIDWPGARSVYGETHVFETVEKMADAILRASISGAPDIEKLQEEGARKFDVARTVACLEQFFWGSNAAVRQVA